MLWLAVMRLARGEPIKENRKVVARALVNILDRLPNLMKMVF